MNWARPKSGSGIRAMSSWAASNNLGSIRCLLRNQ
jgi:hypothetical protein